ncbi:hypothetical protein AD933_05930 [Acetobacter malorum]|uniref:7-cyano-7-deazaguanine synthase n=1 Tax=Acetobacter malorum TaxID=178901 RepID=A0A149RQK4_9PROT|nr:Qat anti-phage system QueC-like protein QatC [Acetobacter malorum]KXV16646.1 hypothetical protein AD933_05930 [Acetobacter malorum]
MKRHLLVGKLGPTDDPTVSTRTDEVRSDVQLLNAGGMAYGVQTALNELRKFDLVPSEIGIDLLALGALVYAADTRIARATEAQDGWTREIRISLPVSDVATWERARPVINRALGFLSGDRWEIELRTRPVGKGRLGGDAPLLNTDLRGVNLFSGGLDSLIGAIDSLVADERPLLVSHAGEGAGSKAQYLCHAALKAKFPRRRFEWVRLPMVFAHDLAEGVGSETSTRARSFLFFAFGVAAGTALHRPFDLKVPENGLIALNVPLDPLRLGALSTRTTHPFYMARWREIVAALGIDGSLSNPYWAMTKGEMVNACTDKPFLMTIADKSISCSSPAKLRWAGYAQGHCGYCVPCLIRRASMPDGDPTGYFLEDLRQRPLNSTEAEGVQIRSFQLAIARLRDRPDLAKILIHKPGPLYDHDLDDQGRMAGVYARGLEEVGRLLDGVRTRPR